MSGNSQEDMLAVIRHLEGMINRGECLGIAFAAILSEGRSLHGYAGAVIDQPDLAVGLLTRVISNIQRDSEEDSGEVNNER
jgi:hypothetical protein